MIGCSVQSLKSWQITFGKLIGYKATEYFPIKLITLLIVTASWFYLKRLVPNLTASAIGKKVAQRSDLPKLYL